MQLKQLLEVQPTIIPLKITLKIQVECENWEGIISAVERLQATTLYIEK